MANVEEIHFKMTDLDRFPGMNVDQPGFLARVATIEFVFDQSVVERCGVDWGVYVLKEVSNGARMVFVTMGDDNTDHLVSTILDVLEIGNDIVDSDHIVIREHHPNINNQYLVVVFIDSHVLTDFTQTTKRDDS